MRHKNRGSAFVGLVIAAAIATPPSYAATPPHGPQESESATPLAITAHGGVARMHDNVIPPLLAFTSTSIDDWVRQYASSAAAKGTMQNIAEQDIVQDVQRLEREFGIQIIVDPSLAFASSLKAHYRQQDKVKISFISDPAKQHKALLELDQALHEYPKDIISRYARTVILAERIDKYPAWLKFASNSPFYVPLCMYKRSVGIPVALAFAYMSAKSEDVEGLERDGIILVNNDHVKGTFYHEFFHSLEMSKVLQAQQLIKQWNALREESKDWKKTCFTEYGMTSGEEDRAEAARFLLEANEARMYRAQQNRVLERKIELVKEIYRQASDGQMDERFWKSHTAK